jgi:integrase
MISIPPDLSQSGNRERKYFETEEQAENEVFRLQNRHRTHGELIDRITSDQLSQALQAFELIGKAGVDVRLPAIVEEWLQTHRSRTSSINYIDLFNQFIEAKPDRNERYLEQLHMARDRWPQLHEQLVCDIGHRELHSIISKLSRGARNPILRYWQAVFNFGIKRGYLTENPVSRLDFERSKRKEIETLSAEHVQKMLEHALEHDLHLLPFLVFGVFCGVRPDGELQKIEWSDIDLTDKVVTIRPEISKTNRRRFVDLSDNAVEWLRAYDARGGRAHGRITTLSRPALKYHRTANRKAAGVLHWPNSALRHTYCSNWLAMHEDVNKLVLQSGHDSVDTMWRNYHRGTTKKEAESFWAITPPKQTDDSKVIPFKAA